MNKPTGWALARVRIVGIVFFLVVALFVWFTIAIYNKQFTTFTKVKLVTDSVGNSLPQLADVKVRGLTVGHVKSSSTDDEGKVTSVMDLQPSMANKIPSNVTARLLPKTLFGERYVDLVVPDKPSTVALADGMTVPQDSSGNALELTKLFDTVLPLLQAVPPQSLAATLGAVAEALSGRGTDLGVTVDRLNTIFEQTNAVMPDLQEDIKQLATFSHTYADALPELVDTLNNLRTTNATIVQRRADIDALIQSLTPTSGRLADFFNTNRANLVDVAADSRETLENLAEYSPTFPCTTRNFAYAIPKINKILGMGTNEPGSKVSVKFSNPRGRYLPNQDEPRWLDPRGPACEPVPPDGVDPGQYPNGSAADGSYQPPTRNPGPRPGSFDMAAPSLVAANATSLGSPMEKHTLGAIYSAATGIPAKDIPSWTTAIGAPALRGSEVSVR